MFAASPPIPKSPSQITNLTTRPPRLLSRGKSKPRATKRNKSKSKGNDNDNDNDPINDPVRSGETRNPRASLSMPNLNEIQGNGAFGFDEGEGGGEGMKKFLWKGEEEKGGRTRGMLEMDPYLQHTIPMIPTGTFPVSSRSGQGNQLSGSTQGNDGGDGFSLARDDQARFTASESSGQIGSDGKAWHVIGPGNRSHGEGPSVRDASGAPSMSAPTTPHRSRTAIPMESPTTNNYIQFHRPLHITPPRTLSRDLPTISTSVQSGEDRQTFNAGGILDFRKSPSSLMSPEMTLTRSIVQRDGHELGGGYIPSESAKTDWKRPIYFSRSSEDSGMPTSRTFGNGSRPGTAVGSGIMDRPAWRNPARGVKMRGKAKVTDLNVVVVGSKGVGKTSFANSLLSAQQHPKLSGFLQGVLVAASDDHHLRENSPSIPSDGFNTVNIAAGPGEQNGYVQPLFDVNIEGTKRFKEISALLQVVDLDQEEDILQTRGRSRRGKAVEGQTIRLNVVDTPGLCFAQGRELENDRYLRGLSRLLEDRFVDALKEESKVDRHTSGRDGMVHLVIYLLDPRSILAPSRPIASAWSGEDKVVYDFAKANETYDTTPTWSPHVRHAEIQAIERLRKRAIVLPVIARSDTLTKQQRKSVKEAVLKAFAPGDTIWDDWAATASDDFSSDEDSSLRTELEQNISRPLEITDIDQPYFVFSPEPIVQSKAIDGLADDRLFEKAYPWATIDALDPAASDLVALYSKLLAKMTDHLRTRTREDLYEQYRTEQLTLAKQRRESQEH